jgi:hypothetical protein
MASVWDLAVVATVDPPEEGHGFGVWTFAVPGGKSGVGFNGVDSLGEGAAGLMQIGYEPFGASRTINPATPNHSYDSVWFRREVPHGSLFDRILRRVR